MVIRPIYEWPVTVGCQREVPTLRYVSGVSRRTGWHVGLNYVSFDVNLTSSKD